MPTFLTLKLAAQGFALAAILALLTFGYQYVKHTGYTEGYGVAEAKYELIIKDYNQKIQDKLTNIESTSNTLAEDSRKSSEALSKDVTAILVNTKGKTLTIIKNGECIPSETFSNTFREINVRTNQTLKELSK